MRLFRKADVLVLLVIAVVIAGLLLSVPATVDHRGNVQHCMANVRNIVGLLEIGDTYPSDLNLRRYLVEKGEIEGAEQVELFFCPGDSSTRDERGTSYAWRDQRRSGCRVAKGAVGLVLICDDSADHHGGEGFVVGYAGGVVRWRDNDYWKLRSDANVTVGKDSVVPELRCLRAD